MKIFADVKRDDPSPASHSENSSAFLGRVAGPYWDQVRALMENWFGRLCEDAQTDVRSRLLSADDRQFQGAFLELYLHEFLLRGGYQVTCHPKLLDTKRRPDFWAEKDGEGFYLEARSASFSDETMAVNNRQKTVYDSFDKLDSPNFFLWIDVERHAKAPLGARPLRRALEKWLATLDPDAVTLSSKAPHVGNLPTFRWESGEWAINFRALPKSPRSRGYRSGVRPLGAFGGGKATWVDDAASIKDALGDKGGSYGALDAAFVVAVGTSSLSSNDHDVKDALFGSEALQFGINNAGKEVHQWMRLPNGYWRGDGAWVHRQVSAVLIVKDLYPAFVARQRHTFWKHPNPEWPVTSLPAWRRAFIENEELHIREPEVGPDQWFGLPSPWPSGDPFPKP